MIKGQGFLKYQTQLIKIEERSQTKIIYPILQKNVIFMLKK
jgi:hypothetical protein